ncbi:hypothetical protein J6590_088123 [Homalodisca vitripennis]|nr:hypothetical protein J6590_088123 [Homalodisca vitripennis]
MLTKISEVTNTLRQEITDVKSSFCASAAEIEMTCGGVTGGSGPSQKMYFSLSERYLTSGNELGNNSNPTLMSIHRLFITGRVKKQSFPVYIEIVSLSRADCRAFTTVTRINSNDAVKLLYAPRLGHYMVLGPVLGQVVTLLPCNTPLPY